MAQRGISVTLLAYVDNKEATDNTISGFLFLQWFQGELLVDYLQNTRDF